MTAEEFFKTIIPKEKPKQDRTCTHNCSVVCGECEVFEPKKSALNIDDVVLRFKLRLNVDEWGMYKKGDEDYFDIKFHDEKKGLTRFPIDRRWDVIGCEIVNIA